MKKIGLLLAASLLSLSLVACGGSGSSDAESKTSDGSTTITETVANSEDSEDKEKEKKKGHGQNPEDYEGTELELFGLSYEDNYINLVDCTAEDMVWFLQKSKINIGIDFLSEKIEPYGTRAYNIFKYYNPTGDEILAKDCKISEIHFERDSYGKYNELEELLIGNTNINSFNGEFLLDYAEKHKLETYKHDIIADVNFAFSSGQKATIYLYPFNLDKANGVTLSLPKIIE